MAEQIAEGKVFGYRRAVDYTKKILIIVSLEFPGPTMFMISGELYGGLFSLRLLSKESKSKGGQCGENIPFRLSWKTFLGCNVVDLFHYSQSKK